LYALYLHLPTSTWFRFPGEFVYLTVISLACAAGIGADVLSSGPSRRYARALVVPAVLLVVIAILIRIPLLSDLPFAGRRASVALLAPALMVLVIATRSRPFVWVSVLAAVWIDLSLAFANYYIIPDIAPDRFEPPASLTRFLHDHQGMQRTYFHVPPLHAPLAKTAMMHQLYAISDHESLMPLRYAEYEAWLQDGGVPMAARPPQGGLFLDPRQKRMKLLNLLGVRFIVTFGQSPFVDTAEAAGYPLVFEADGAQVYENPRALPRAFVVGTTDVVPPGTMLSRLAAEPFEPLETALVETTDAAMTGGVSRPAQIIEYAPERVVIRTSGATPGMLILTDQFYPGWLATVDDQPTAVYCADYIFRAVVLPPGDHTVRFRYRPRSVTLGSWTSLVALCGLCIVAVRVRHRQ
jgi:hypothetical protein